MKNKKPTVPSSDPDKELSLSLYAYIYIDILKRERRLKLYMESNEIMIDIV